MYSILYSDNIVIRHSKKCEITTGKINLTEHAITGLVGEKGSGKTSLMQVFAGIKSNYQGEIKFCGHLLCDGDKKDIAYLPSEDFLPPNKKVCEIANYISEFFPDLRKEWFEHLINKFSFDLKKRIRSLSKDDNKLLRIALILSRKAKLYVLDDLFGQIDSAYVNYIKDMVLESCPLDSTVIISGEKISYMKGLISDLVVVSNGNVIFNRNLGVMIQNGIGNINDIYKEILAHDW